MLMTPANFFLEYDKTGLESITVLYRWWGYLPGVGFRLAPAG